MYGLRLNKNNQYIINYCIAKYNLKIYPKNYTTQLYDVLHTLNHLVCLNQ